MAENIEIIAKPIGGSAGIIHIDVKGRIDAYTVGQLEAEIEKILAKTARIILTLSKVDYVNSTGVGLLVKYHDKADAAGGSLVLTEIPDKVEVVFNMLGLLDFFNVYQTIEDSVKAFQIKDGGATSGPAPSKQVPRDISEMPANTTSFPLMVRCLVCNKNLKFEIRGYYRCPSCSCHYVVTDDGKARGFKNLLSKFAELRLPCSVEFFDTAVVMTRSILDKTNLPKKLAANAVVCVQKLYPIFCKEQSNTLDMVYVFNQTSISMGFLSTVNVVVSGDAETANAMKDVQKLTKSLEFGNTTQGATFCRFSIES